MKIESLDLEAQGVAHDAEGKVVFVEDALTGEEVQVQVLRRKNNWEQARVTARRRDSAQRVVPKCPHFGTCGGCKMQHFHVDAQVATKQRALEDALWHLGKVRPEQMLRPIAGPAWRYRHRARLSVRHVAKKGTVLVGFHERKSSYVADMDSCEVLPAHVSALLLPLRGLVGSMDQRDRLPQIEVAIGGEVTALVLRHLEPLTPADLQRLRDFGRANTVSSGGCSQRGRTRSTRSTKTVPRWRTNCRSSMCGFRSCRQTSPRSIMRSTRSWSDGPCGCWTSSPRSA